MKKILAVTIFAAACLFAVSGSSYGDDSEKHDTLTYFFSDGCHRCIKARQEVMPRIEREFEGQVRVEYRNIDDPENYKLLFNLKHGYGADEKSVFPVLYLNGNFIDARDEKNLTYVSVHDFIKSSLTEPAVKAKAESAADINSFLKKAGLFALLSAGFIDGINPCAFTSIVFFMSYLFFQGYRKSNIAITGLAFILTVFFTYILIGIGIFGSLYALKGFWRLVDVINISIGVLSLALGIISLYDAFRFRKTGNAESMMLQLPKYIKNRIHSTIGGQFRMTGGQTASSGMLKMALSAIAAGFLISIFESVCTGQLYLPAITYIMKATPYKLTAFVYLVLYNLAFIVPLLAIFGLTMLGVTSQVFSQFIRKNMMIIKIFLAIMFLVFGVTLVSADTLKANEDDRIKKQDPYFWDFGTAKEGAVLKHKFSIRNSSANPMKIKQVNTSCGCTTVDIQKGLIEPGESGDIEVVFNTKGYPGGNSRYIFVHTDDPKNPTIFLHVRAQVVGFGNKK